MSRAHTPRPTDGDLRCPCHGASFDLQGRLANYLRSIGEPEANSRLLEVADRFGAR